MGASFISGEACFANEESAEKLSMGLVSGGDMRVDTDGRRFMLGCWAGCQPAEVIPNQIIEKSEKKIGGRGNNTR
jgi:hypothetical protein